MGSLPELIKKILKIEVTIALILLLALNPMGSSLAASINSQEFFMYHIRDAVLYFDKQTQETDSFYLATGTYEEQLSGDLFGAAKGRDLIVVQMESMQNMVIGRDYYGQEITPALNEIIRAPGTLYFNNFYYQIGSGNTSDAEFAANNSILGSMESYTYQLYKNNYFRGLPHILKDAGYNSYVMHGYKKMFWNRETVYPALGFLKYYSSDHFVNDNIKGIGGGNIVGISDSAFFLQAAGYMEELQRPYYSFLITLSCHNPFALPDYLKELDIKPEDNNLMGSYLNAARYSDRCIGEFMEHLTEKGLYENSMIVFYGDHFGIVKGDRQIEGSAERFIGSAFNLDVMMNVPFIIHIPGLEINKVYENSGGQLDIMPTLAYLLGIEKLDTLYLGQNLFTGEDSVVAIQMHMLKGSYIKGDTVFEISRDGIFENSKAWNRKTGAALSIENCGPDSQKAREIADLSVFYLENDILRLAIGQGRDIQEIKEILKGTKSELPDKLGSVYIEAVDKGAVSDFYGSMTADRDRYVMLLSDDILALLEFLEREYSGKSKRKGIGSTDVSLNRDYLDVRSRIIPVVTANDSYTKVEYLGYDKIMLDPGEGALSIAEINKWLLMYEPCGVALFRNHWAFRMHFWSGSKIPVFFYDFKPVENKSKRSGYGFIRDF